MGDFAELNIRLKLKIDTPVSLIEILEYMASKHSHDFTSFPEHPLF